MPHKLLLADDSVTIQRVIELTFADEDVQLTAVGDGKLAIEHILADPPDIVLADVGMPEKDGYEVAAFIKNDPRFAHIPVLLLTGAFEPVDEERARAVGCDGVLAKPFEPQMVITRVKELLAEASRPVSGHRMAPPLQAPFSLGADPLPPAAVFAEPEVTSVTMVPPAVPPAAEEPADEPFAIESALDAAVRIRRRQTMAVPEFGVPPAEPTTEQTPAPDLSEEATPVPGRRAELDEYFERLDSSLGRTNRPSAEAQDDPLNLSWELPADEALTMGGLAAGHVTAPVAPSEPSPVAPPFDTPFPADASPVELPQASVPETETAPDVPEPPAQPVFAQAFSALLAAERGDADAGAMPFFGVQPPPEVDTAAIVAQVTRQVLEQMTDRVVRDTVTDIVSKVAERLVRDEIERVRASIK
jgi:CheY-like chemotaxis protein